MTEPTQGPYDADFFSQLKGALLGLPTMAQKFDELTGVLNKLDKELALMQSWRVIHERGAEKRDILVDKILSRIEKLEKTEYGALTILRTITYVCATIGSVIFIGTVILKFINQ